MIGFQIFELRKGKREKKKKGKKGKKGVPVESWVLGWSDQIACCQGWL